MKKSAILFSTLALVLVIVNIFSIGTKAVTLDDINATLNQQQLILNNISNKITSLENTTENLSSAIENLSTSIQNLLEKLETFINQSTNLSNDTIAGKLDQLIKLLGYPTDTSGNQINTTLFMSLSAIAAELLAQREALSTIGSNQGNLSKYTSAVLEKLNENSQYIIDAVDNSSRDTKQYVNNMGRLLASNYGTLLAINIFVLLVIMFFIIGWEILGLKYRFRRMPGEELLPLPTRRGPPRKECFGNPEIFDRNSPECQSCYDFEECAKEALASKQPPACFGNKDLYNPQRCLDCDFREDCLKEIERKKASMSRPKTPGMGFGDWGVG